MDPRTLDMLIRLADAVALLTACVDDMATVRHHQMVRHHQIQMAKDRIDEIRYDLQEMPVGKGRE